MIISLHETFQKVFEYIYSKALTFKDYKFIPTENQNKQISNFITFLGTKTDINSIGLNWVYDFVLWGIRERVENNRTYKGKVPMNWVIGKKAYESFENKPADYWAFFNKRFAREKGILFSDLQGDMDLDCLDYYNGVRKENYKKGTPLRYCYETAPYEKRSAYCLQCKDKKVCIKINS